MALWTQKTNGRDLGLTTDVIITAGRSAGGTLAALAGTAANSSDPGFAELEPVDGCMSISGLMTWKGARGLDAGLAGSQHRAPAHRRTQQHRMGEWLDEIVEQSSG